MSTSSVSRINSNIISVPHHVAGNTLKAVEDVDDSSDGGTNTTSDTKKDQGPAINSFPQWQPPDKRNMRI